MTNKIKQAVILAGGLGTRLRPFTNEHPKPMYRFNNKPFIEYLVEQVKSFGIKKIVILLGYKAQEIQDYLGDGSRYGLTIEYSVTPVEYETGNRLLEIRDLLDDRFLLMYCDNYCPIDFDKLVRDAYKNDAAIQITAYTNRDNYTKDNLLIATDGKVEVYDKKRETLGLKGVDIGYAIIKKETLDLLDSNSGIVNFEKEVYPQCVAQGELFATSVEHRYYSIGSWNRIELTEQFFSERKTIFLDRDGTLNVRPPKACYVERPEGFVWLPGAKEAIQKLKENGYRLILVSNQPGIARGNLSVDTLNAIHDKMQADLRQETGYEIDAMYYCPHNWDEECECRKPKPGMLYEAQKEYSLNLRKCILIGDDERDIQAGKAAGCKCYQVKDDSSLLDIANKIIQGD
ncbi:HAD-IIIA family hydrolase [Schwartzia succinivorans]|jgi:D-glycero-D-manno-heptose 1,7-bisphosphate phosphatase|uniref:D,D-heptose 1,7-bisphosphate phosphatase n=1 Tax=Schwartzia succinivorans DSM 10502 TaxID=1123243 RepID=A0A1M4XPV2_9FIRM|nr:HAD-IIIA family hydrolase [Schwartzia succinivorans]SHE95303.1 D-glycero-D-manno-heptose 1,7-bisphosphate phosphatase [Schwartzia succinivorans DSM 10502]